MLCLSFMERLEKKCRRHNSYGFLKITSLNLFSSLGHLCFKRVNLATENAFLLRKRILTLEAPRRWQGKEMMWNCSGFLTLFRWAPKISCANSADTTKSLWLTKLRRLDMTTFVNTVKQGMKEVRPYWMSAKGPLRSLGEGSVSRPSTAHKQNPVGC